MPTTACPATVLIVDDTPANLKVIGNFLAGAGYRILVAEDGADALEQVQTTRPDIILLDVMMPEKDGYATCRELKQLEATRDVPVLFMTARSETHEKVKGFRCGAVDYITKPYQEADVLARIHTHLTLARQKQKLEAMLAERNRFMNIAAHDLRNPLASIMGWAELGSAQQVSSDIRQIFDTIHHSAQRMQAIVEDFLSLQILKNQETGEPGESFDLREIILQAIEQQEPRAKGKNLTLLFRAQPDIPFAFGNAAHTHQMVTNYLSNAIKFSPPDTEIQVNARVSDGHIRLMVKDQGPGVPQAERSRLFAEFPKISNQPTGGESSTGLGLAIVKTLAEAQGGKVGAEFPDATGSTFWADIPVAKAGVL
jgi:two-component system, sensor histidine kinase and response regulator